MSWLRQYVIAAPFEKFESTVQKTISDGLDEFLKDYLIANPIERPVQPKVNESEV
jgi:hypothetical protein